MKRNIYTIYMRNNNIFILYTVLGPHAEEAAELDLIFVNVLVQS